MHMAVPLESPQGTLVSAVDLGTDEIRTYLLSPDGTLAPLAVSACRPAPARASCSAAPAPTWPTSRAS